ncbi:MAG: hypothetical protein R3200_13695 [Xanthomonadales bacterium]|nr:hypothetical protein [Xanthomonadales bacterium]
MKRPASNEVLVTVAPDGSVHVPAGLCEALGLRRGEEVRLTLCGDQLVLDAAQGSQAARHFGRWRSISHALALEERKKVEAA